MPKRRPRVCFISRFAKTLFFPGGPPAHGGSETQFYLNSRELARRGGLEVHAVVQGDWDRPPERVDGVHVHFMPFGRGAVPKIRFQRLLSQINADVYLQQGIGSATKEVALFCMMRRRRFIYWVASNYDVDPSVGRTDLNRGRLFEWGLLRADLIVAQTEHQAERLRAGYGRDSLLIANGFPEHVNPRPERRDAIVWVGRCVGVKRPELFIELARRLPEERCVMIAPTGGAEARRLHRELRPAIEATPNLEHLPGIPFDEVQGWFDRAQLLVNTSLTEGFPNTFVQAMWSATPIASLAFDADGLLARGGLGVAPTGDDLDRFAGEIRGLLGDPERWSAASARALEYARSHHSLTRNMDRLQEAIDSLIAS